MAIINEDFSFPQIDDCYNQLESKGVCVLSDALDDNFVNRCRDFVGEWINSHGERYFTVTDVTSVRNSPFSELTKNVALTGLIESLVSSTNIAQGSDSFLQGDNLRIIAGKDNDSQAMKFHYDSSVLTMLVPVFIPKGEAQTSGDLVIFPNQRKFGGSVIGNLFEKLAIQNRFTRARMAKKAALGLYNNNTIKLVPGSIYFFWGYRSLHANFSCLPGSLRATALFFFGNPQPNDAIMKIVTNRRIRAENKIRDRSLQG